MFDTWSPAHVCEALERAARYVRDDRSSTHVTQLCVSLGATLTTGYPQAVDEGARQALRTGLNRLWSSGWMPIDIHQIARRRCDTVAAMVVVDAIADAVGEFPAASLHSRWRQQLDDLGAVHWWSPAEPALRQWMTRHGIDPTATINAVVELIHMLKTLGPLPFLVPPPGGNHPGETPAPGAPGMDEKILGKVRALLAKAESTTFDDEAEALSAKAHELMARHSVDRALTAPAAPTPTTASRIWLEPPYLGAKALVMSEVASAHRCRTVSYEKLGFVTVVGESTDVDAVRVLGTSLMVQATRAMLALGPRVSATGRSRTRSFRHSFLIAYATRIGERLREATDRTAAEHGDQLLPVLAARAQAVDAMFTQLFGDRIGRRTFSVGNTAGYGAGRTAADRADLGSGRPALPPTRP